MSHAKIFAYLDEGELPIDNNLAEETIRKLTTQCNSSLHYDSDASAEVAATYHSLIRSNKASWQVCLELHRNFFQKYL